MLVWRQIATGASTLAWQQTANGASTLAWQQTATGAWVLGWSAGTSLWVSPRQLLHALL